MLYLLLLNLITNSTVIPFYSSIDFILKWMTISALFASIEGLVYFMLEKVRLHKVFFVTIVFFHVLLFVVDIFLYYNFKSIFNQDAVDIMAQTTSSEAKSFLSTYLTYPFVISTIILITIFLWCIKKLASLFSRRKAFAICFMLLSLTGVGVYFIAIKNYVYYHNGESVPQLHSITRAAYSAKVLLLRHNQIVSLRDINSNIKASKSPDYVNTIIVVIGESFNAYHSSLYGYFKETNPLLAKRVKDGSLVVFNDVATFSDHTEMVMCSVFPLNNWPEPYFTDPLFPVCFKSAGYHTTMLDNQYFVGNGVTFLTDEVLSSQMFDYRNSKGYQYDENMLQEMKLIDSPQLIVLHLQGQHYTYADRYPKQFSQFTSNDYANLSEEQKKVVANYDNATLYNDYVIDEIIKSVEDKDCLLVYFSDHGEEVYELGDYMGHGNAQVRSDPTYQLKVPLLIWTSETFCEKHHEKAKRIKESADKPIATFDLPHFLIDVAGINTKSFHPEQSFINDEYKPKTRMVLNHSIDYDKLNNQPRIKSRYY